MKIVSTLIFSICILILSCQNQSCNCEIVDSMIIKNDSIIDIIINEPNNEFKNYWNRFDEPTMNNENIESYRFSIVVLLYDFCKIYRVEKKEKKYNLHVKEYAISTTLEHREDSLVRKFTKEISRNQWNEIKNEFEKNCFWTMPVDIKEDDGYLDGSSWVLEAKKEKNNCTNSNYHIVHRVSPYDTTRFKTICKMFTNLDSLNVKRF